MKKKAEITLNKVQISEFKIKTKQLPVCKEAPYGFLKMTPKKPEFCEVLFTIFRIYPIGLVYAQFIKLNLIRCNLCNLLIN